LEEFYSKISKLVRITIEKHISPKILDFLSNKGENSLKKKHESKVSKALGEPAPTLTVKTKNPKSFWVLISVPS
jgi:hypothetical protein